MPGSYLSAAILLSSKTNAEAQKPRFPPPKGKRHRGKNAQIKKLKGIPEPLKGFNRRHEKSPNEKSPNEKSPTAGKS